VKELKRVRLAHLPTPVEELPRLSAELGGPRLLIKRDDQTGLAFGGNKTRKLEYLLADAQNNKAKTLITAGAIQSNHCRQTAAAAARFGFDCILVLGGNEPEVPEANTLLDVLLGADIVWTERENMKNRLLEVYEQAKVQGRSPYIIPYGGSNPTGASAYAYAIRELATQDVEVDWVVFATSSGGTQAGMVVGAELAGFQGSLLGISVDEPKKRLQESIADLAVRTAELLGEKILITPKQIMVNDDYVGLGYAVIGKPEVEAIHLFARLEGILVDPVYTGRAAAGLIDLIRNDFFNHDETILFWHTGGTPALFADKYEREVNG
jgi:D-cysteine desulfhydrase family pyridoxal phosphate-dependent enzyme